VQICHDRLASLCDTLAELEQVALENLLVGRLVGGGVDANGRPDREARGVHLAIVIREGARAGEELLAVALVREPMRASPKSCTPTNSMTVHLKRLSLSAGGQPVQYLPGTEANLPTATAGFGSSGKKPVLVMVFWAPFFSLPRAMAEKIVLPCRNVAGKTCCSAIVN
jgi:hypothetical protein